MKAFKISKDFAIMFYSLLLIATVIMAFMLFRQYRFFEQEASELTEVKDSYYQHVEMLKRSLNASLSNTSDYEEDLEDTDDKKKNEEVEQDSLSVPNLIITNVEPEFELISADEESRLNAIKKQLQKPQVNRSSKKLGAKLVKSFTDSQKETRYSPVRSFNFSWPIDLSRFWLSSLFGPRRLSTGKVSFHYAIDMAALKGTPVKAAAAGRVTVAQALPGYGNTVVIIHNDRYKTRYAHLDTIDVQVGNQVKTGQLIGGVGDTGFVRKTGKDASHLHFEIYQDGQRVNPLKFLFT